MSPRAHALVVGGSRGIGRAVVRSLAADGQTVSIISRSEPVGFEDVPAVKGWTADVADAQALRAALSSAVKEHGPVTGAVLLQRFRGDGDNWAGELATSLTATRDILEWLDARYEAVVAPVSVVVIGSAAGSFIASEQPASYHVAKAGVMQLVRYYAVAPGSKGVRVNAISPGTILKEENQSFYQENAELEQLYRDIIPVGRMGTAQDVANVAMFLLSERAAFLTGQNIILDGGVSLHWHEALARRLSPMKDLNVTRPPANNA